MGEPTKMAIESVYARAVIEQEDTSPNLQGLLIRLVDFRERLRKFEQVVGYVITNFARTTIVRLESADYLANDGTGNLRLYPDTLHGCPLTGSGGPTVFTDPDCTYRLNTTGDGRSTSILLLEVENYQKLEAVKLIGWFLSRSEDLVMSVQVDPASAFSAEYAG